MATVSPALHTALRQRSTASMQPMVVMISSGLMVAPALSDFWAIWIRRGLYPGGISYLMLSRLFLRAMEAKIRFSLSAGRRSELGVATPRGTSSELNISFMTIMVNSWMLTLVGSHRGEEMSGTGTGLENRDRT